MADKHEQTQPKTQSKQPRIEGTPKPESTSEYEGAESRQPTGNQPVEVKTESTSEYEGADNSKPSENQLNE